MLRICNLQTSRPLAQCQTSCSHRRFAHKNPIGWSRHLPCASGSPGSEAAGSSSTDSSSSSPSSSSSSSSGVKDAASLERDLAKVTRQVAGTFAPRASLPTRKNPAFKGSLLYDIFEYQAWVSLAVGGLLSFNVIFPTDEPSIARLMGMWSIWMFTIPSLRAKECMPAEKDSLNLLFLLVPLLNVGIPFISKSFPLIFMADVAALLGVYYWKGVWREVYNLPIGPHPATVPVAEGSDASPIDTPSE